MGYKFYTLAAKKGNYGSTRTADKIKYIVVHYTANNTDTAKANATYFSNNVVKASAHYFVDDSNVYQSVPDKTIAYAVGGGKYSDCNITGGGTYYGKCTNANSLSIEMCSKDGQITNATVDNATALIKNLMKAYGVPATNVIRHFDVNGKKCPGWRGWIYPSDSKWSNLKKSINSIKATTTSTKAYATVNATSGLKMRNISGVVLYTIPNNTKVEVKKKNSTTMTISGTSYKMTKITYKGEEGYVASTYLKF